MAGRGLRAIWVAAAEVLLAAGRGDDVLRQAVVPLQLVAILNCDPNGRRIDPVLSSVSATIWVVVI